MGKRYGMFKYGDGTRYGISSYFPLLWICQIDWDGDGEYDRNEAPWLQSISIRRGREYVTRLESSGTFKTNGIGFEMPSIGEAVIYLDNEDGRYDAYSSSSPLYPNVMPGRKIVIKVEQDLERKSLFTGKIAYIIPKEQTKQVVIRAVDGLQELGDQEISVDLQTTRRIDQAIGDVLDAMSWPEDWGRNLDSTPDYLPYFWADGESGRQVIRDLMDDSLGVFFVAGDGKATFRNRYRNDTPTISLDQENLGQYPSLQQPWDVIYNRITLNVHPRAQESAAELWRLFEIPSLSPGETREIFAEYSYGGKSVPASSLETIEAATDYTFNTQSDGGGSDLTADLSVSVTQYAKTAKLTITNNGASTGYITLLRLRGVAVTAGTLKIVVEDTDSQALYGLRDLVLDNEYLQEINNARALAVFLLDVLKAPSEYPAVSLQNQFYLQFPELFEYVNLSIPAKNISRTGSDALQVGYIEINWLSDSGQEVETILRLEEPVAGLTSLWTFPTEIGVTSVFNF